MVEIYNKTAIQWIIALNTIIFIGSVLINYLGMRFSWWGPINSISAMSDKYFTMITPAKYTFGIWGVIYTLGTAVVVSWWRLSLNQNVDLFNQMSALIFIFMAIAILNPIWIVMWTREKIILSWLVMVSLLLLLMVASKLVSQVDNSYSTLSSIFFNVYLGWISVAFSINTSVLLMNSGTTPMNMTSMKVASMIIVALTLITLFMLFYFKNITFTIVILWALLGIYFQNDARIIDYKMLKYIVLSCAVIVGSSLLYYIYACMKNLSPPQ